VDRWDLSPTPLMTVREPLHKISPALVLLLAFLNFFIIHGVVYQSSIATIWFLHAPEISYHFESIQLRVD